MGIFTCLLMLCSSLLTQHSLCNTALDGTIRFSQCLHAMPHNLLNFSVQFVISMKRLDVKSVYILCSFHRDCKLSKVCSGQVVQQQAGFSQDTFLHAMASAVLIVCSNRCMCTKCNTHTTDRHAHRDRDRHTRARTYARTHVGSLAHTHMLSLRANAPLGVEQ